MSRSLAVAVFTSLALAGCAAGADAPTAGFQTSVVMDAPMALNGAEPAAWSAPLSASPQVAGWMAKVVRYDDSAVVVEQAAGDHADVYKLDSGDRLRIFVYAQPSLSRLYAVDAEGFVSVPLIGDIRARGLSARSLAGVIRSRLAQTYVRDPHVTVDIQQHRPFFILGEVRGSGQYPFVPGMTVEAAVAIAGGFSERANERIVQITRRMNGSIEKLDAARDAVVRPGDTIYVTERWF